MGNLLVDVLLPWRMLAMLLHFISAMYVISWVPDSAQVTIVPSTTKDEAFQFWRNYIAEVAMAALTIVALLCEFLAMSKGATLMSPAFNLYFTISHALAVLLTVWMLTSGWTLMAYVVVYVCLTLPPALTEVLGCLVRVGRESKLEQERRCTQESCTVTVPQCYFTCPSSGPTWCPDFNWWVWWRN